MNLRLVTGTPFKCQCARCDQFVWAGEGYSTMADLDGRAFEAYYCKPCLATEPDLIAAMAA